MENKMIKFPCVPVTSVLFSVYFMCTFFLFYIDYFDTSYLLGCISTFMIPFPYLLMALFTLNSKSRTGIGFSVACFINLPIIVFLNLVIWRLWDLDFLGYCGAGPIIQRIYWWVSFLFTLAGNVIFFIIGILTKIIKKPLALFKAWFLFPLPFVIFFISETGARLISFINAVIENSVDFEWLILSILYSATDLILVIAFFFVSYQFAKINKNLPVAEATAITQ